THAPTLPPPGVLFYGPAHPADPHAFPTRRSYDLALAVRRTDGGPHEIHAADMPRRADLGQARAACERTPRQGVRRGKVVHMVGRSEEHTSELQSRGQLVCRLLLEKTKGLTCRGFL